MPTYVIPGDTLEFYVTGLTAGTSYNLDLVGATGNASDAFDIQAFQQTSTTLNAANRGAPATMMVFASL